MYVAIYTYTVDDTIIIVEVVCLSLCFILHVDKCSQAVIMQHLDSLNKPLSQTTLGN